MSQSIPRDQSTLGNFIIVHPAANEAVALLAGNKVAVEVDDTGGHNAFKVAVYNVCDAPPAVDACQDSLQQSGNTWTGSTAAGFLDGFDLPENHKNVVVYGQIGTAWSSPVCNAFRIVQGVSCSGSVGGVIQQACSFCPPNLAPPARLQLTHAGGIASATCTNCELLNAPALLCHSNDPCFHCCWFSGPITFCGADPGYWKLQKTDATTWQLQLLQASAGNQVALYKLATGANVCAFPITLARDTVTAVCTGWPAQITLAVSA